MEDFLKSIKLLFVGLLVAVIIYPILHETSHFITAVFAGAKVIDFKLLPLPYIMCEVSDTSVLGQALIGASGVVIPYFISMWFHPKMFWVWYVSLIIKFISVYSVLLSIIGITFCYNGKYLQSDDFVQVLYIIPNADSLLIFVLSIMGIYGVVKIVKQKPFYRCIEYFNIKERTNKW